MLSGVEGSSHVRMIERQLQAQRAQVGAARALLTECALGLYVEFCGRVGAGELSPVVCRSLALKARECAAYFGESMGMCEVRVVEQQEGGGGDAEVIREDA